MSARKLAAFGVILLSVILALGISKLRLNAHYSVYFDQDDPLRVTHLALITQYAQQDSIVLLLQAQQGNMLLPAHYAALEEIVENLATLTLVAQIRSIADPRFWDDNAEFAEPTTTSQQILRQHPRVSGLLLSKDARFAVIEITTKLGNRSSAQDILGLMSQVRAVVTQVTNASPVSISAHYTGTLALNEAYIHLVRHDLRIFIPGLISLLLLGLYLLLGYKMIAFLLPGTLLPVAGAFGAAGWLGLELAALHAFAPVMLISLAVASYVHLSLSYRSLRSTGMAPDVAATASLARNQLPLTLTTLTTVLGFLLLLSSPSPPVRVLGILVAVGISLSYLLNRTLLIWWLARFDSRSEKPPPRFGMARCAQCSKKYPATILLVFGIAGVAALGGLSQLSVNDNVFGYFPETHQFRQDTRLAEQHLSGINQLLYSIETDQDYGLFSAAPLHSVANFATWLRAQAEVRAVVALTDLEPLHTYLGSANLDQSLARYRRLAADRSPAEWSLAQEVSANYAATRVLVLLGDIDAKALIALDQRAQAWLNRHLQGASYLGGVGTSLILAQISIRNARSMFYSLGLALAAIALLLGLILRSVHAVWIGLICNLFPVALAYAGWALLGEHITLGSAAVMGLIVGIVADDTLYLLTRHAALRQQGVSDALTTALQQVGPALVVTSTILCAGLAVGLWSDFQPIVAMSALSITIIGLALATDMLLLPVLVRLLPSK